MTPARRSKTRPPRRGGATLTEVLMALLVMGIGLVSVATLFPLSLLRSVEATKMTSATLLRINAEARIRSSVGTDTFGNVINRAIVEDPDNNGVVREHDATKFFYDPLGRAIYDEDGSALETEVGWIDADNDGQFDAGEAGSGISRFAFGLETLGQPAFRIAARNEVSLPDSYVTLADVAGGAAVVAGATLTFTEGGSLGEYVTTPPTVARVTFIHADGTESAVRDGAEITGANSIDLKAALPATYSGNIGRVTVEIQEQRYSWLATVRRFGLKPSVTIAVFFRRAFDPLDERIYSVSEPAGGYNEFELPVPAGTERPPGLRVGGYMFDVVSFRWIKIASIEEITMPTSSGSTPGVRFTTDPEDIDPTPRPRTFQAMFPRNVVEAYTLKKN